jgi:hypothetical protein
MPKCAECWPNISATLRASWKPDAGERPKASQLPAMGHLSLDSTSRQATTKAKRTRQVQMIDGSQCPALAGPPGRLRCEIARVRLVGLQAL